MKWNDRFANSLSLKIIAVILIFSLIIIISTLALKHFMSWEAVATFLSCIITFVSVILVLLSYWTTSIESNRMAQREIYQKLELASIDLFRMECHLPELASLLWDENGKSLDEFTFNELYTVKSYIYQMLNLFEMACRFRRMCTMEPEVFGSWVIWMYELANNEKFQKLWLEMKSNYVGLLQEIFDEGIILCHSDSQESKTAFFRLVGEKFKCAIITGWFSREESGKNANI